MSEPQGAIDRDSLIEQLQAAVADPTMRTERAPTILEDRFSSMSLGGMVSFGRSLADSLRRVVDSNQAGRMPDPDVVATADRLQHEMTRPAPRSGSLRRAAGSDVQDVEAALGLALPSFLARLYLEVADGGFGPSQGLVALEQLVRETRRLRNADELPRGRAWPATLLPFVARDPGWFCVDLETGAIVEWDPEDLTERASEERFRRSFTEVAPSIEAWLAKWLRRMTAARRKPSAEDRWARMAARAQTPEGVARQEAKTRRYLAQMSPEDRKQWGFDELYPELEEDGGP